MDYTTEADRYRRRSVRAGERAIDMIHYAVYWTHDDDSELFIVSAVRLAAEAWHYACLATAVANHPVASVTPE